MAAASRFVRALVLSTWLYSLLLWLYITARIVLSQVDMSAPFIEGIPRITFLNLGIFAFVLSFLCLLIYLSVWGFSR